MVLVEVSGLFDGFWGGVLGVLDDHRRVVVVFLRVGNGQGVLALQRVQVVAGNVGDPVLLAGPEDLVLGAHVGEPSIAVVVVVPWLVLVVDVEPGRFARLHSFVTASSVGELGHVHVLGPAFVEGAAGQEARRLLRVVGERVQELGLLRIDPSRRLPPLRSLEMLFVHVFLHQEGVVVVIVAHRILFEILLLLLGLEFGLLSFQTRFSVEYEIFIILLRLLVLSQLIPFLDHDFWTSVRFRGLTVHHFVALWNGLQKFHHRVRLVLLVVPALVLDHELLDNRFDVVVLLLGRILDLLLVIELLDWRPVDAVPVVIVLFEAVLYLPAPVLDGHEWLVLVRLFLAVRGLCALTTCRNRGSYDYRYASL